MFKTTTFGDTPDGDERELSMGIGSAGVDLTSEGSNKPSTGLKCQTKKSKRELSQHKGFHMKGARELLKKLVNPRWASGLIHPSPPKFLAEE